MLHLQWRERFNIGVGLIDRAHRQLFAIVRKMMDLYVERHEDRFACMEGIKFFKAYAFKHFTEEEAYMRQIGYPNYAAHKQIHDRMRYETLPELERMLYDSDFSPEAVQRFIGVCTGWLTGHILIEDQAITGAKSDDPAPLQMDDEQAVIQAVIVSPLQELLGYPVQYAGRLSPKDSILHAQFCELSCHTPEGGLLRIVLVMNRQTLLHAAGALFEMDFPEMNDIVRFAVREIAQNMIQRAAVRFGMPPDAFRLDQVRFLEPAEFAERPPQYRFLFRAENDSFAICLDPAAGSSDL